MRNVPQALRDHLASGVTTVCWCWRLIPENGHALGFTDHDRNLLFDGQLYEASSGFTASELENTLGLSVDNLDVSGALQSGKLTETDLFAGRFDNAKIEIWLVNWRDADQRALLKSGTLGEVRRSRNAFSAEIRGLSHFLNQPDGRQFQFGCDADLGDGRCGVDLGLPAYSAEGQVVTNDRDRLFEVSGLVEFEDRWFSRGQLTWLTGANADRRADVKSHFVQAERITIELWQPVAAAVQSGDAFHITAGCDKQFSTCRAKFANGLNFRGFPHMPGNDFVASYPNRDDGFNDGSSRNA